MVALIIMLFVIFGVPAILCQCARERELKLEVEERRHREAMEAKLDELINLQKAN